MEARKTIIQPVHVTDMLAVTQMTYANMTGVDQAFTRLMKNPLYRWAGYFTFPLYFWLSGRGYKAVLRGRIVGCAYLNLRANSGYVFNVNVNRQNRRQGVGRQLMEHLETVAQSKGRSWLALQVDDSNSAAQRLYAQMGYRPYHPYFFRRDATWPIQKVITSGLGLEAMTEYQGRRVYARYMKAERENGDTWASQVVDEYEPERLSGGVYWRCKLHGDEMGCAWRGGSEDWPSFKLALDPKYWGHVTIGGLIKLLVDRQTRRSGDLFWADVRLASSAHHQAAVPMLNSIDFQVRTRPRFFMLKSLT